MGLFRFRCLLRLFTGALAVFLGVLHGPSELLHYQLHRGTVLAEAEKVLSAPASECPLCCLAALTGPLPDADCFHHPRPITHPALPWQVSLDQGEPSFYAFSFYLLRAPPHHNR